MPRELDATLKKLLKEYGLDASKALWDCHGTWVMYHWAVEQAAGKAGVVFGEPSIIESNSKDKIVALMVTATLGDKSAWSIGEAAPSNNKNAYVYAMAEKRAKDRAAIKVLGLHGVYSEEEADDFKDSKPQQTTQAPKNAPGVMKAKEWAKEHVADLHASEDGDDFMAKLDAEKAYWVRVHANYPGVWSGPENSGLVNDGAAAASVYEVRDRYDKFINWIETKAAEVRDQAA